MANGLKDGLDLLSQLRLQGLLDRQGMQAPAQAAPAQAAPAQVPQGQPQVEGFKEEAIEEKDPVPVKRGRGPIPSVARKQIMPSKEFLSPEKRKELAKMDAESRKERLEVDKYYRPLIKEFNQANSEVVDNDRRLGRMERLVDSKNLSRPRFAAILETLKQGVHGAINLGGINFKSLLTGDSQEFDKLSKEMLKGAKSIFGARLTNVDVEQFMDMIPTLTQSREGKRRIIHNMRLFNEGVRIRKRAMDDILEENEGIAPRNLESLIEKRSSAAMEALAERFKEGYKKPVKDKPKKSLIKKITRPVEKIVSLKTPLDILLGKG